MASEPLSSSWPSSWHRGLPEHALQARPESFATSCPARLFYGFWRCGGPVRSMVAKEAQRGRVFTAAAASDSTGAPYEPTEAVLGQLRAIAPGWDRQALVVRYRQWSKGKVAPDNPHGAFIGWAKRFTKKQSPS
jgi:hypothetical protein